MRATQSCVGSGRPVGPRQPRSPWVPPQSGGMLAEHGALGGPFTPAHAGPSRPIPTVTAATASVAATQPFDIIPPREQADIRLSRSRAALEYAIEVAQSIQNQRSGARHVHAPARDPSPSESS